MFPPSLCRFHYPVVPYLERVGEMLMGSPVYVKGVDCFFGFKCICYLWPCSHIGMESGWKELSSCGLSIPYAVFALCLFAQPALILEPLWSSTTGWHIQPFKTSLVFIRRLQLPLLLYIHQLWIGLVPFSLSFQWGRVERRRQIHLPIHFEIPSQRFCWQIWTFLILRIETNLLTLVHYGLFPKYW